MIQIIEKKRASADEIGMVRIDTDAPVESFPVVIPEVDGFFRAIALRWHPFSGDVKIYPDTKASKVHKWKWSYGYFVEPVQGKFRNNKLSLSDNGNRELGLAGRMVVEQMLADAMEEEKRQRGRLWWRVASGG